MISLSVFLIIISRSSVMTRKNKIITFILFIIYILLLTWIVIFKTMPYLTHMSARSLNLEPFKGTAVYHGRYDYKELVGNILIFVPLGMYISVVVRKFNLVAAFVAGFTLSLIYETVQYELICGAADVTDVLMNTLGALIGAILYLILKALFRKKHIEIINTLGIVILCIFLAFKMLTTVF